MFVCVEISRTCSDTGMHYCVCYASIDVSACVFGVCAGGGWLALGTNMGLDPCAMMLAGEP